MTEATGRSEALTTAGPFPGPWPPVATEGPRGEQGRRRGFHERERPGLARDHAQAPGRVLAPAG